MSKSPEQSNYPSIKEKRSVFDFNFEKLEDIQRCEQLIEKAEATSSYSPEEKELAIAAMAKKLYWFYGDLDDAIRIKNAFSVSEEEISSPEVQKAIRDRIGELFYRSGGKEGKDEERTKEYFNQINRLKEEFFVPEEQIREQLQKSIVFKLESGVYGDSVFELEKLYGLDDNFLLSDKIVEAAKKGFSGILFDSNDFDLAIKIQNRFQLPEDYVKKCIKEGLVYSLNKGDKGYTEHALKIKETFKIGDEFLNDPDIYNAACNGIIRNLEWTKIREVNQIVDKIKKNFSVSDEFMKEDKIVQARIRGAKRVIFMGCQDAFKLDNFFALLNTKENKDVINLPDVKNTVKEALGSILLYGQDDGSLINFAVRTFEKYVPEFSKELLDDNAIKQAVEKRIFDCLFAGRVELAVDLKEKLRLAISPEQIKNKFPEIEKLLLDIKDFSPEFYNQAENSIQVLFSLFKFIKEPEKFIRIVRENPFLIDTISENQRYGSRLLLKWPQFDALSKENIKTLFAIKKEVLADNPEMEAESIEFRQLVQERLKTYKNNPEILKAIEEQGINLDEWLNYTETKYFQLESGAGLSFSETISAPIERIKETLDSYAHTIKEVLKEYKKELTEYKISLEDVREIQLKISQMRTEVDKAVVERDERKAEGIKRGIASFEKKLENIKTTALWNKILGEISTFQRLKDDLFNTQEKLTLSEDKLQEALSGKMPSGRIIQDLKRELNTNKEDLKNKFGVLERRIEEFKTDLPHLISPALGQERAESLIQDIELNLAEQFDHYNADRGTLANLFSEKNDKEKEKLENQPMSIFVWAKNPDIDLYQGNYSPCCICIDSAHMGAESTIADYNTDLGIQIVNIWDETKNEPVTAAWCWLGKDEKGETALVIDNIESNTLYSANYSEQLTKELLDYLKEYAKTIGVKKLILGKANNDLPTAGEISKLMDDENKYKKIGGYNRPDGYFLEAENRTTKIIWSSSEAAAIMEEEQIERIKFENFDLKSLQEKDFMKLQHLEEKIYAETGLVLGQTMVGDIKRGKGLEYSSLARGKREGKKTKEVLGYLVAVEDETDEGDSCIYLEDIAVIPEARGQKFGWEMLKNLIEKLQQKATKENKPQLLDMHLREGSQRFIESRQTELEQMGVKLIEEALCPNYYDEGEDALYKVYEISVE
ncbi:MAG: GNAT family N-acetyltransferase [bacterium]